MTMHHVLRYIQIRENAVREIIESKLFTLKHIEGKVNVADLFTKEDKDIAHFISIRDILVQDTPTSTHYDAQLDPSGSEGGVNQKS